MSNDMPLSVAIPGAWGQVCPECGVRIDVQGEGGEIQRCPNCGLQFQISRNARSLKSLWRRTG